MKLTNDVHVAVLKRVKLGVLQGHFIQSEEALVESLAEENLKEVLNEDFIVEFLHEEGHREEQMIDFDLGQLHFVEFVVGDHEGLEHSVEEVANHAHLTMMFRMKSLNRSSVVLHMSRKILIIGSIWLSKSKKCSLICAYSFALTVFFPLRFSSDSSKCLNSESRM